MSLRGSVVTYAKYHARLHTHSEEATSLPVSFLSFVSTEIQVGNVEMT